MASKENEKEGQNSEIKVDMGIISLGGIVDLVNKMLDLGISLKDLESKLQKHKAEGKVRSHVDIRIGSVLDPGKEIRIGSGAFFKHLDELAKERRDLTPLAQRRHITISSKDLVRTEFASDVIEQEDHVYVLTQVPYEMGDLEVTFRKHTDGGELVVEAPKHGYKRMIPINVKVDASDSGKVQWNYRNQVIEAILPKAKANENENEH